MFYLSIQFKRIKQTKPDQLPMHLTGLCIYIYREMYMYICKYVSNVKPDMDHMLYFLLFCGIPCLWVSHSFDICCVVSGGSGGGSDRVVLRLIGFVRREPSETMRKLLIHIAGQNTC